jgi:DNA-binding response OmpR family regulator
MRLAVRYLLERRHSEIVVSEAVDGVDAIEKARETNPDLILLDLAMPRLNGAETASVLKNTLPETPIILFTMYTDLHADSLSTFIGVDFVSKADGVSKLLERVDALLPPNPNEAPIHH